MINPYPGLCEVRKDTVCTAVAEGGRNLDALDDVPDFEEGFAGDGDALFAGLFSCHGPRQGA